MVAEVGLEPTTYRVWTDCSSQLSYSATRLLIISRVFHFVNNFFQKKLDGTAKGGVVFSIAQDLKLPVVFVGTGEGIDDIEVFDAKEFVNNIF